MSYDLMVFRPDSAPKTKKEFMEWYEKQTEWDEGHSYDDPANTSDELRSWFMEMKESFPALNGPYASDDHIDDPKTTDYCIGQHVIYAAFGWSEAEGAYKLMKALAAKHKTGFFDASGSGDILVPANEGTLKALDSTSDQKPWWKLW